MNEFLLVSCSIEPWWLESFLKGENVSGQQWKDYEGAAEHGPMRIGFKILMFVVVFAVVIGAFGFIFGWFGEAANVAQEEFGPKAMLEKYEWFKDVAAQLDKKKADITVYAERLKNQLAEYEGEKRKDWPRDEREQRSVWQSELAGVKASFNALAAEYNAQMSKFNWRFANKGDLPKGAAVPLPREFKQYISE